MLVAEGKNLPTRFHGMFITPPSLMSLVVDGCVDLNSGGRDDSCIDQTS